MINLTSTPLDRSYIYASPQDKLFSFQGSLWIHCGTKKIIIIFLRSMRHILEILRFLSIWKYLWSIILNHSEVLPKKAGLYSHTLGFIFTLRPYFLDSALDLIFLLGLSLRLRTFFWVERLSSGLYVCFQISFKNWTVYFLIHLSPPIFGQRHKEEIK